MQKFALLLLCLTCLPVVAKAQPKGLNDGTYDAYDCKVPVSDQRIVLKGNHISFYESACQMSNPQTLRGLDGPILFDAACKGEGETWATRFIFVQSFDGGLVMMGENWGDRYQRCN
ncbi:hypothetical protein [Pseudogemmobacter sp. W21_MBD1_M6]|uniref:hypothetical protein n=1 Tax=Pseudogemmobacter sp. W21_MBD1_M6 TaxID=3240271 RepID=UPI003F98C7FA